jgi:tetratricopeptide (TPR) repeat protein
MAKNIFPNLSFKLFTCFLLGCLLSPTSYAKVNVDSLRQIWTNAEESDSNRFHAMDTYYMHYAFASPDSVLALAHYHYNLAQQKNIRVEVAEALDTKAFAYSVLGKYDSAIYQLQQALELVAKFNDSASLARIYGNLGLSYYNQSKYLEAVQHYTLSLEILQKKGRASDQADMLNNLGLVYLEIKRFDLALDFLNEALKWYNKAGMAEETGNIWLNIGSVYFEKGDDDQALIYCQKALKILQASNHLFSVAECYYLIAQIHQQSGQPDSAWHYVNKSLRINQEIGNKLFILKDQIFIANLMLENEAEAATRMGEEMLPGVDSIADNSLKRDVFKLMYTCYKKQKNYPQALLMHEKYKVYADSVQIEENNIAIVREAVRSEFEFKLLQNQLENEQAQAQLKLKQLKERYGMILIGLVLIGLILFYTRTRIMSHQRQQAILLAEIEQLKKVSNAPVALHTNTFQLDRSSIEKAIDRKINETDWKVLNILLEDPVIANKEIAEQAFMSVDGIGSSLRRMYSAFDIKESKYKKISLIMKAIKLSNKHP